MDPLRCMYNNNNREFTEHFWKLKALYNLKKNIQYANTHNYTNQWYTKLHSKPNFWLSEWTLNLRTTDSPAITTYPQC